ncbi:unnamed protein product [Schistosoma mattheei]|uniref:Uncharacterized protein n=1 Tax=Schistosoma mattheei TaxID=31246 RepID=A0A183NJK0_9TREM|nr:unnamed protein product [Schistosoma mattheei]
MNIKNLCVSSKGPIKNGILSKSNKFRGRLRFIVYLRLSYCYSIIITISMWLPPSVVSIFPEVNYNRKLSEYSEENIEFWLICELYKHLPQEDLGEESRRIYRLYLAPHSPHEVNCDCISLVMTMKSTGSLWFLIDLSSLFICDADQVSESFHLSQRFSIKCECVGILCVLLQDLCLSFVFVEEYCFRGYTATMASDFLVW